MYTYAYQQNVVFPSKLSVGIISKWGSRYKVRAKLFLFDIVLYPQRPDAYAAQIQAAIAQHLE